MLYIKRILRYKYTFIILGILCLFYSVLITNIKEYKSKYNISDDTFNVIITSYDIDGNHLKLNVKGKEKLIVNYYFSNKDEKEYYLNNLYLGDKYIIKGTLKKGSVNTNKYLFNYNKYLYNHKIYYLIDATSIKKISNNTNIMYEIKNKINKRLSKINKSKGYIKTFILGDKTNLDSDTLNTYQSIGISHLFSISGMHIMLFASVILYVMKKISYNNKLNYLITILFLLFYMILTGISSSVLRATIMFILFAINKCFNLKYRSVDIMMMVFIIIVFINPFSIYDIGFQFSYTITLGLVIVSNKIRNIKNKLYKSIYVSYISFIISFPIVIYNFNSVNILSILLNILLVPYVSSIIFPLSIITFIFPFLDNILYILIKVMENITNIFNNNNLILILKGPSVILLVCYYISIILIIKNNKYIYIFLLLVLFNKYNNYLDKSIYVNYLDVSQGDSILISNLNNKNILIDTGGTVNYDNEEWKKKDNPYNVSKNIIIPSLKVRGIDKIDYLILTHGDNDHMGDAAYLVNNYKVDKVIFNCGEYNDLEEELITILKRKKIKYYSCISKIDIEDNELYFLNTGIYDNENDNSSVIYLNYNNNKFLFMGDASFEKEEDILDKYNINNIDFLKVGHHGSKTSSSEEFISSINPKYSIISVGENNRYGHPNDEVIDILKENNSKIYRTDEDGSIEIKIKSNGYSIETCEP